MDRVYFIFRRIINRVQKIYFLFAQKWVVIHLKCKSDKLLNKTVLLSYLTIPFLNNHTRQMKYHTNVWECKEIANILLIAGFNVDVIHFQNAKFKPKKEYHAIIDIHSNLERLQKYLPNGCIKILHATGSFWLFQNYQEHLRLYNLYIRKEIALKPIRTVLKSDAKDICDIATIIGNDATVKSFGNMGKKFVKIPASELISYNWDESKDFEKCRKNFLWLGSEGFVHKGLDLVIEAFCILHDFHLDICGPIDIEPEFKKAFQKELYEVNNIKTWGTVDVSSEMFRKIIKDTIGIIYPSCSEGTAGSVIVGMHAGLIPLISKESGVDIDENAGIVLSDCSVVEICRKVQEVSNMKKEQLKKMSYLTWVSARGKYTKKLFSEKYGKFVKSNLL